MPLGERRRGFGVARQEGKELLEPRRVEAEARRELPQEGPQLLLEPQYAGGEEIGERGLYIMQLFEVGDKPAALDGKLEAVRGLVMPSREGVGSLERIMRAVDLGRVDPPAGVGELVGLAQPARIKAAAPAAIGPAGNADTNGAGPAHGQAPQSATKAPLRPSGGRGRGPARSDGRVRWAMPRTGSSTALTLPSPPDQRGDREPKGFRECRC